MNPIQLQGKKSKTTEKDDKNKKTEEKIKEQIDNFNKKKDNALKKEMDEFHKNMKKWHSKISDVIYENLKSIESIKNISKKYFDSRIGTARYKHISNDIDNLKKIRADDVGKKFLCENRENMKVEIYDLKEAKFNNDGNLNKRRLRLIYALIKIKIKLLHHLGCSSFV